MGATYLAKPCTLADLAEATDEAAGTSADELESVVRRRLADVAGVEDDAERAFTARLLRSFVATSPAGLSAVQRAADTADAVALEAAAHRLGGAAATLGADALTAACRSLEKCGREGDLSDVAAAVGVLAERLARTREIFTGLAEELEEDVLVENQPEAAPGRLIRDT